MYTFGFSFRPWQSPNAISPGSEIMSYLNDTVDEFGIREHIAFRQHVRRASYSSETATWSLMVEEGEAREMVNYTCHFLVMCSGYYNYDNGYTPDFPGVDSFQGQIVHPQKWGESNVEVKDKKVVVIGSGATAVTIVPNIASEAKSVTMLQRSPSFMLSRPAKDGSIMPFSVKVNRDIDNIYSTS
jgi:cation diffusion facilitator CzcD-associated flavoprotein CzcO